MKGSDCLEELKGIHAILANSLQVSQGKIDGQKEVYAEIVRAFSKFSAKLGGVASKISEEVHSAGTRPSSSVGNEESVLHSYQLLSNSLLRMAECSRKISVKNKAEVLDPLKTFTDNYERVSDDLIKRVARKMVSIGESEAHLGRQKESYNQACEKLEKHKEMQNKIMSRIESGNLTELEK